MLQKSPDSNKIMEMTEASRENDCNLAYSNKRLIINIWDFSGEVVHNTIHQVVQSVYKLIEAIFFKSARLS